MTTRYTLPIWNPWNWRDVESRYAAVNQLDLGLVKVANGSVQREPARHAPPGS
jgi:hypothetical protein